MKVYKVNAHADRGLTIMFGIDSVPTFKLFSRGEPVSVLIGEVYPSILKKMINDSIRYRRSCIERLTKIYPEISGCAQLNEDDL